MNMMRRKSCLSLNGGIVAYLSGWPCAAEWDGLKGGERYRWCPACNLFIYDLDGLTEQQAAQLVFQKEGRTGARYFRRKDRRFLTRYHQVGNKRNATMLAQAALLAVVGCVVALMLKQDLQTARSSTSSQPQKFTAAQQASSDRAVSKKSVQVKLGSSSMIQSREFRDNLSPADRQLRAPNIQPFSAKSSALNESVYGLSKLENTKTRYDDAIGPGPAARLAPRIPMTIIGQEPPLPQLAKYTSKYVRFLSGSAQPLGYKNGTGYNLKYETAETPQQVLDWYKDALESQSFRILNRGPSSLCAKNATDNMVILQMERPAGPNHDPQYQSHFSIRYVATH